MKCYACSTQAQHQCERCAKPYCDEHGSIPFCTACLEPANFLLSPAVFRGSLLALLVGGVVALWLLLRPPSLPGEGKVESVLPPQVFPSAPIPTPAGAVQAPVVTPTPTPTPQPFGEYEVRSGDSLWDIARRHDTTVEAIVQANGFRNADQVLQPGQVLKIPRPSP